MRWKKKKLIVSLWEHDPMFKIFPFITLRGREEIGN